MLCSAVTVKKRVHTQREDYTLIVNDTQSAHGLGGPTEIGPNHALE